MQTEFPRSEMHKVLFLAVELNLNGSFRFNGIIRVEYILLAYFRHPMGIKNQVIHNCFVTIVLDFHSHLHLTSSCRQVPSPPQAPSVMIISHIRSPPF